MRTLVCVITGGRPALASRPTAQYFPALRAAGFPDIEWVLRGGHADAYERDDNPFNVIPDEFADTYARAHWRHPTAKWEPGGFFGAFPGREWAMRTAEERGYDAVLQMDDNVTTLGLINCTQVAYRRALDPGDMLRLLVEFSASTNAMMLGAQLNSVPPTGKVRLIRPGYPYSVFVEKCGPGRMPWYGPFEDDVMHALEYALHGGPGRTAAVMDLLRYNKEYKSKNGMRTQYNAHRGLELPRRYPNNATLKVSRRTSSPNTKDPVKDRAVRHILNTRGFTPVKVTDPDRYRTAADTLTAAVTQGRENYREQTRAKMRRRGGLPTTPTTREATP